MPNRWTARILALMLGGVAVAASAEKAVPLGHPDFLPSPEHPVGWRGDGTGAFPGATPPTTWSDGTVEEVVERWKHPSTGAPRSSSHWGLSDDKVVNIAWKSEMPGWAHSSPIVVGDKVFTTAEPDLLVCVDAETGKILWQQRNIVFELDGLPAAEAAARDDYLGKVYAARIPWRATAQNYIRLPSPWSEEAARTVIPRMELTVEILQELVRTSPHGAKAQQALADFTAELSKLKELEPGTDTKRLAKPFEDAINSAVDWLAEEHGVPPLMHWDGWLGWTFATPISDGRHVYASMGQGQVVCYDLDGKRHWALLHKPTGKDALKAGCKHVPSPMLADGILVAQMPSELIGVDAANGKLLWTAPITVGGGYRVASHCIVTLGSGRRVVATSHGKILDLRTGKQLGDTGVPAYGKEAGGSSLVAHGDVVAYIGQEGNDALGVGFKLIEDGNTVRCEPIFKEVGRGTPSSPVVSGDLVHFFMRLDRETQDTWNLNDGTSYKGLSWPAEWRTSCSPILAGDVLIALQDKYMPGRERSKNNPYTIMRTYRYLPPDKLQPIKLNNIVHRGGDPHDLRTIAYKDRFIELDCWSFDGALPIHFGFGSPFAHGSRVYLRSLTHLICFGK